MLVSQDFGQAQFSGTLTTMTSAKGINSSMLNIPSLATHWMAYHAGDVAALIPGDTLTGGTSNATCKLHSIVRDVGSGGDTDSGILLVNNISGIFVAETLTGTSTGTVHIDQAFTPIRFWTQPRSLLITVETASVNVCFDGITPVATAGANLGHTIEASQSIMVSGIESIRRFKAINSVNANGAIIKYSLYF